MSDTPMAAKPKPSTKPARVLSPAAMRQQQAISDLTRELNPYTGIRAWWHSNEYTSPLNKRRSANGLNIITYTLEASAPLNDVSARVRNTHPLNAEQRRALYDILATIEKIANVRFVQIEHIDRRDAVDIRLFQGDIAGPDGLTANCAATRDVVIRDSFNSDAFKSPKARGYEVLLHEVLHALGLSHPEGHGNTYSILEKHLYNKDDTVMAGDAGKGAGGLGRYDVAALQYLYGRPGEQPLPPGGGQIGGIVPKRAAAARAMSP